MSNRHEPENYYAILGIARTASFKEIRAAFRTRAKALHPDKNRNSDTKEDFQRLREAYAVLGRPEERRRYDFSEPAVTVDQPVRAPAADPAPPPRPWRKYGFAGLTISLPALALLFYWIGAPATNEPTATELEKEMEATIARDAGSFTALSPEPAGVAKPIGMEVIGRKGQKFVVSDADYERLIPIHDHLVTESKRLQKWKQDLDARRADLEKEEHELAPANIGAVMNFRLKVDAFNLDGADFRRHFELHAGELEDYFSQIERRAMSSR